MTPHPLDMLSLSEVEMARQVIIDANRNKVIDFREIFLQEPPKEELKPFLDLEHAGHLNANTPRPARLAKVQCDVFGSNKVPEFHESIVDVEKRIRVSHEVVTAHHASLTL
jgi:primary-amine oxidase